MTSITRGTVYGRIVPALAILLGLSNAFIHVDAVHAVLLFALVAASALGWLAPGGRSPQELARREERRQARHERRQAHQDLRSRRRAGQSIEPQAGPLPPAQSGPMGPVLDGIPQDTIRGEERER